MKAPSLLRPITVAIATAISITTGLLSTPAFAGHPTMGVAQDHMHLAADSLHKAKGSTNPLADLENALGQLDIALHNKIGHRAEAAKIVELAIAQFKQGDRVAVDKSITEALAEIDKAVEIGHRNLKH